MREGEGRDEGGGRERWGYGKRTGKSDEDEGREYIVTHSTTQVN